MIDLSQARIGPSLSDPSPILESGLTFTSLSFPSLLSSKASLPRRESSSSLSILYFTSLTGHTIHTGLTLLGLLAPSYCLDSELERRSELVERKNQVEPIEALVALFEDQSYPLLNLLLLAHIL